MNIEGQVKNISHIVINSSDFKATVKFYELLGFKVDRIISNDFSKPGDINDMDTVPLNVDKHGSCYCLGMGLGRDPKSITKLEIIEWTDPEKKPGLGGSNDYLGVARIAFSATNIKAIVEKIKSHGHKTDEIELVDISPTLSSSYVHLYDPDGNWVTLMEWIKKKPI